MLCYYNVRVSRNRGMFSCFAEHHWVASSMIYAFYPTTCFQLDVYCQYTVYVYSTLFWGIQYLAILDQV